MPSLIAASPQITVHLYKSIARQTVDGQTGVSARYQGKDDYIDLTGYLNLGSSVRTCKSVREPAGAFAITFADKPHSQGGSSQSDLESVYGLVEPMDMIEIRMWSGIGAWSKSQNGRPLYPIKMRGFVGRVSRGESMGDDGRPQRTVMITGHDYGKIWQMYQVLHLPSYAENKALLTNFGLWELFGIPAENTMKSADFVSSMIEKIINPFLTQFMPPFTGLPRLIQADIAVKHGVINNSYQNQQGSVYDIMRFFADVGVWNELYTEDREDGVYCVYRPIPSIKLTRGADPASGLIQDDAVMPPVVTIADTYIKDLNVSRSDDNVANFFWVNNARYDLIDDQARRRAALTTSSDKVSLSEYPNSAVKYYGVRPMYVETQQSGDGITNATSGLNSKEQADRAGKQDSWIDSRLQILRETNKDNVVYERGTVDIKGGILRDSGEHLKAGDYVKIIRGKISFIAYVVQIDDNFMPFRGYTSTLQLERCEGFVERVKLESGSMAPWLAEQATRSQ
jgi:hypothetical protein